MKAALAQARRGLGRTHPNPAVGAVIVRDGVIIARGFHARAGAPHAEAVALKKAGAKAKGATVYSTLEPCNHFGRTPPCTEAIIAAGVAKVAYGSSDPNPLVNGKGVRRLRRAGVEVVAHVLKDACDALNAPFFKAMRAGLPFVTVKAGVTLDGKIATAKGASKWITSAASRERVHALRDQVDAIVVGAGTVEADDPALTTRGVASGRNAARVVIDPSLRTSPGAKVYERNGARVIVVSERAGPRAAALAARGVEVWPMGPSFTLRAVLGRLAKEGLLHVLVEGGADTTRRFLSEGLVDEVRLFIAPKLFGHDGLTWTGALGVAQPAEASALEWLDLERVGPDLMVRARVVHR